MWVMEHGYTKVHPPQNDDANWLSQQCNCRSAVVPCTSLYVLIAQAYAQDDGAFYRELRQEFQDIAAQLHNAL